MRLSIGDGFKRPPLTIELIESSLLEVAIYGDEALANEIQNAVRELAAANNYTTVSSSCTIRIDTRGDTAATGNAIAKAFEEQGIKCLLLVDGTYVERFTEAIDTATARPVAGGQISTDIVLVEIPSGGFMRGSPESEEDRTDDEGPQSEVKVQTFLMGKYLVTQTQWAAARLLPRVSIGLREDPSHHKGPDLPVDSVNWYEAVEFCDRLSRHTGEEYRLPSEAEWEYACRAGTATRYSFGDEIDEEKLNCSRRIGSTTPVGNYPPNGFGLHDMHGNLWEWCLDSWHENYEGAPNDGAPWLEGGIDNVRTVRGGSWNSDTRNGNSSYRDADNPGDHEFDIGFRVVRGGSWNFFSKYCRSSSRTNYDPDVRGNHIGFRVVRETV